MFGLGHLGEFALGQEIQNAAEVITADKWLYQWSEPIKKAKTGPAAARSPFVFLNPVPVVSFSWFDKLNEPVRVRRRLPTPSQPFFSYQPAPIISIPWFGWLSEPTRQKRGLPPRLQQFYTGDSQVIPVSKLIQWFAPLSDPVRKKPGLKASLQQFLAAPSRLLPTPTSFGVLDALETKDTFLAGAMVWNRITDAEIGVINTTPQPAEIGLYPTAPTAGTITVRISIVIG